MLSTTVGPALESVVPVQTAGMPLEVLPFLLSALAIIAVGMLILIPVCGFTARFALKPLLEQIIRLRDTDARRREVLELQARVSVLEQHLLLLGHQVSTASLATLPRPELLETQRAESPRAESPRAESSRLESGSASQEKLDAELSQLGRLRGQRIGSGEA